VHCAKPSALSRSSRRDKKGAHLNYQAKTTKPLPGMKWQKTEVEAVIGKFDRAAYDAGSLLDKLGEITPTLTRRCSQRLPLRHAFNVDRG
jgi:hypothetical protein